MLTRTHWLDHVGGHEGIVIALEKGVIPGCGNRDNRIEGSPLAGILGIRSGWDWLPGTAELEGIVHGFEDGWDVLGGGCFGKDFRCHYGRG